MPIIQFSPTVTYSEALSPISEAGRSHGDCKHTALVPNLPRHRLATAISSPCSECIEDRDVFNRLIVRAISRHSSIRLP